MVFTSHGVLGSLGSRISSALGAADPAPYLAPGEVFDIVEVHPIPPALQRPAAPSRLPSRRSPTSTGPSRSARSTPAATARPKRRSRASSTSRCTRCRASSARSCGPACASSPSRRSVFGLVFLPRWSRAPKAGGLPEPPSPPAPGAGQPAADVLAEGHRLDTARNARMSSMTVANGREFLEHSRTRPTSRPRAPAAMIGPADRHLFGDMVASPALPPRGPAADLPHHGATLHLRRQRPWRLGGGAHQRALARARRCSSWKAVASPSAGAMARLHGREDRGSAGGLALGRSTRRPSRRA